MPGRRVPVAGIFVEYKHLRCYALLQVNS